MLVNDAGPHVGDLGPLSQPVDHEGVEVLVVADGDVDEEVLEPGRASTCTLAASTMPSISMLISMQSTTPIQLNRPARSR